MDADGVIEARLGDLDQKLGDPDRRKHWANTERTLIDEGWYTATESDCSGRVDCSLSK